MLLLTRIGFTNNRMYDVIVGSVTDDLYYFGSTVVSSIRNTILLKVDSSDTIVWSKVYDKQSYTYLVDIDSSETYIYLAHVDSIVFPLIQISTTSGEILTTKELSAYTTSLISVSLRFFQSSDELFFSVKTSPSHTGV